jgi:hypothetical protein
MAVKKQPESAGGEIPEAASDWFRQFLKLVELTIVEMGPGLPPEATPADCRLAAMRAVKLTLLDSGVDEDAISGLFGQVALEDTTAPMKLAWSAEMNNRRFELIDGDIQGTLSRAEQLELARLTQLMREHVDSEDNLPLEGAKKLHRLLSGFESDSTDPDQ